MDAELKVTPVGHNAGGPSKLAKSPSILASLDPEARIGENPWLAGVRNSPNRSCEMLCLTASASHPAHRRASSRSWRRRH
jgi:hypothetical protein